MLAARKLPTGRRQKTTQERLRARVFELCKELGIDEEARRVMAGAHRADGLQTLKGMGQAELYGLVETLGKEHAKRLGSFRNAQTALREQRLRQHKRVDGEASPYASLRARKYLEGLARGYWGEGWSPSLNRLIMRMNSGYFLPYDSEKIPRGLHWRVTEALKAMLGRKG